MHADRFIPAGAGNTLPTVWAASICPVYPRWRGEHYNPHIAAVNYGGLSPLARGTRERTLRQVQIVRFIPAGAGNTAAAQEKAGAGWVYPRWRGEHTLSSWNVTASPGLSPLARGTRRQSSGDTLYRRFIPAGAGNTSAAVPAPGWCPVYPRWRGEHDLLLVSDI